MAGTSRAQHRRADRGRSPGRCEGPHLARARRGRRAARLHPQGRRRGAGARAHRGRGRRTRRPRPHRRRRGHPRPGGPRDGARATRRGAAGLVDPDVLSYVWIHRFPMYAVGRGEQALGRHPQPVQRRRARGRVTPRDDLGRPPRRRSLRSGRPGARAPVRPRAQRLGARRRVRALPLPRAALALVLAHGPHARAAAGASFGGILEAFEYGAPPHGGIALGIDRWAALLTRQTNIREVMAFPKTSSGSDLMLDAPSPVEPGQLAELGLALAERSAPG